jgi:hypothetical protein
MAMQLGRAVLSLPVLVGLLVGVAARGYGAASEKPIIKTVDTEIKTLGDMMQPDETRAASREWLVLKIRGGDAEAAKRLIELGEQTKESNVRLQVAFTLAQSKPGRMSESIVPEGQRPAAIALLSKWLNDKEVDAGVRLWAAVGLANMQDEKLVGLLSDKALGPSAPPQIRAAVARALAGWRGQSLETAIVPELVKFLAGNAKDPDMQITACDALRFTDLDAEATVVPLVDLAGMKDTPEKVWRAAIATLRRLAAGQLDIKVGFSLKERRDALKTWETIWRKKRKLPARQWPWSEEEEKEKGEGEGEAKK